MLEHRACWACCAWRRGAHPPPNTECDWAHVYKQNSIPPSLEYDAAAGVIEPLMPSTTSPATVTDPDRTLFYLSLREALAMALEHGTVGARINQCPRPGE